MSGRSGRSGPGGGAEPQGRRAAENDEKKRDEGGGCTNGCASTAVASTKFGVASGYVVRRVGEHDGNASARKRRRTPTINRKGWRGCRDYPRPIPHRPEGRGEGAAPLRVRGLPFSVGAALPPSRPPGRDPARHPSPRRGEGLAGRGNGADSAFPSRAGGYQPKTRPGLSIPTRFRSSLPSSLCPCASCCGPVPLVVLRAARPRARSAHPVVGLSSTRFTPGGRGHRRGASYAAAVGSGGAAGSRCRLWGSGWRGGHCVASVDGPFGPRIPFHDKHSVHAPHTMSPVVCPPRRSRDRAAHIRTRAIRPCLAVHALHTIRRVDGARRPRGASTRFTPRATWTLCANAQHGKGGPLRVPHGVCREARRPVHHPVRPP